MPEVIVFCSGALVMVLELAGSRFLAPFLGTSLVVWTSLIGVVLAFLALGAWFGGLLADRRLSQRILALILAGAGLATAAVGLAAPFAAQSISFHVAGLRSATLLTATLLMALPATLFGMITPYVIRLRLKDMASSGTTVGRLSALGTVGSIVGTFLGGFFLVAHFGTTQILLGAGAVMAALAVPLCRGRDGRPAGGRKAAERKQGRGGIFLALLLAFGAAASGGYATGRAPDGRPALVQTPYNSIVVGETRWGDRVVRTLSTDPGGSQSGMYPDDPDELAFAYTRFYALGPALAPKARTALMLGGGAYSVPRWLYGGHSPFSPEARQALELVVVELDPGMTRVARERFGLPDAPGLRIVHEDARRFLNTASERYDLVFVDLFNSSYSIPFHVVTDEAVAALRRVVAPGGVVVCNVIAALEGEGAGVFQALYASVIRHFAEARVFAVRDPEDRAAVQNLVIVALADPDPRQLAFLDGGSLSPDAGGRKEGNGPERGELRFLLAGRARPPRVGGEAVFTDDFAPVERYVPLLPRKASLP